MRTCTIDGEMKISIQDDYAAAGVPPDLHVSILDGYVGRKVWRSKRILRSVQRRTALPPVVAYAPLRLCEQEIVETVQACDPDRIQIEGLRWGGYLLRLLRRHHPEWLRDRREAGAERRWRKFDPTVSVSIVLPTFDGGRYLAQAVESCLNQTFRNVELLVVDDGSTADIRAMVPALGDPRVRFVRHERNQGLAAALNTGFGHARGRYLTWTSDDNYYAPSAIEEMLRFLQTYSEVDFVYAEQYIVEEDEGGVRRVEPGKNRPPAWLRVGNAVNSCFLYTRRVYETVGAYDPRAFLVEDYDYWIRVWRRFRMQRLFRHLYHYRLHPRSLTAKYSREDVLARVEFVKRLNGIS